MTRKKNCNSKSNSFVAAAEQVCLQPVLEHRQRRGRRTGAPQQTSRTSLLLLSTGQTDRRTDQWTLDRYIDPAPCTMQCCAKITN